MCSIQSLTESASLVWLWGGVWLCFSAVQPLSQSWQWRVGVICFCHDETWPWCRPGIFSVTTSRPSWTSANSLGQLSQYSTAQLGQLSQYSTAQFESVITVLYCTVWVSYHSTLLHSLGQLSQYSTAQFGSVITVLYCTVGSVITVLYCTVWVSYHSTVLHSLGQLSQYSTAQFGSVMMALYCTVGSVTMVLHCRHTAWPP